MVASFCLSAGAQPQSNQQLRSRVITANINHIKGELNRSYNFCVGAGRANEGLRADWQRQLLQVKRDCGFRYLRFHGLLSDDMGVYKEDKAGNSIYNWQYIDELFDYLLSIDVKPFVELGFMPDALASGKQTIFWWKGNITPPKDYVKWNNLIKHLVEHWSERYGKAEVGKWYFEVWNEPNLKNLFFTGNQSDYFKLYSETAKTIKEVSATYRVGGPATAGNAWIPETIDFCVQNNAPIDFISTHDYGVKQGFLDETGTAGTVLNSNKNMVPDDMARSRQQIAASKLPKLELHYTEWSSSYTPSDPIHDSYHEAAYILNTIKRAGNVVNSLSYWTFTDIFEEAGPRMTPFHGGFGLLNYQDIKKPAYYAFQYLNKLGNKELANSDSSSVLCTDKNGNIQALLWDYTLDQPEDSVNNQVFYKRDLPAKAKPAVTLKLNGLSAGKYKVVIYQTGYRVNDAYAAYMEFKSPSQLSRQQVAAIKQKTDGHPLSSMIINVSASGSLEKVLPMRSNDVYFLSINKIK